MKSMADMIRSKLKIRGAQVVVILPDQERVESITDIDDLDEVISTERHLFDVACSRARDHLWVSGVEPVSGFLDDLAINRTTSSTGSLRI